MTKTAFQQWLREGVVILDGATGSQLLKRGMPHGVCSEQWILEHPEALVALQQEYVQAGARILYAPTFGANRSLLRFHGLEGEVQSLNQKLVNLSKTLAGEGTLVAGDLTMSGLQLEPGGDTTFEELVDIYREQAGCMADSGADLLVIETMVDLAEARAALIAAQEACSLPVMVTMTFGEDGRTLYGATPEAAVIVLQSLGADAVGINCSAGPDQMLPLIERMAAYAQVPLIAKPNAGLPHKDQEGNDVYDMDEHTFLFHAEKLVAAGASLIGGCCGTSPEYIRLLARALGGRPVQAPEGKEAAATAFTHWEAEALGMRDREEFLWLSDGEFQEEELLSGRTPLVVQAGDAAVLERALRIYPGRAVVLTGGQEPGAGAADVIRKYGPLRLSSSESVSERARYRKTVRPFSEKRP